MTKHEFTLEVMGESLHCIIWRPDGAIRAAVQIVHGMVEYADRYDETARYLCSRGYLVISHDHPGHGLTAANDGELGYIRTPEGSKFLVGCCSAVTDYLKNELGDVPIFIFGHSMGSFVVRRYLTVHSAKIKGAAIIGTGDQTLTMLGLAKALTRLDIRLHGERHRSRFITMIAFGSYTKRCRGGSPYAWITTDGEILKKHDNDKYATFIFTSAAYLALFDTLEYLARGTGTENIPHDLPVYVAAGSEDPVGSYGKAPKAFAERLRGLGLGDVTLKIYDGCRHEIFNEKIRSTVYADFAAWLDAHTEGAE